MKLYDYSSVIQLVSALYFGFVGLRFLEIHYERIFEIVNKLGAVYGGFYNSIISGDEEDTKFTFKELNETLEDVRYFVHANRLKFLLIPRIREIFIKSGLFSLFLLIIIANESNPDYDNYFGILGVVVFYEINFLNRVYVFFQRIKNERLISLIQSKKLWKLYAYYGEDKPLWKKIFSTKYIYHNSKVEVFIRCLIFMSLILLIYHSKYIIGLFVNYEPSIEVNQLKTIIVSLISLFLPYLIIFIIDVFATKRLSKLKDEVNAANKVQIIKYL